MSPQKPQNLTFTVDSALLSELGEKIVERVHVALAELVKNSYDADATRVEVKLLTDDESSRIEISDDGHGMTFEEVQMYWMRIATTHKKEDRLSPRFWRPKTGAKGIGRFCCRRLGTHLKLITTARVRGGKTQRTVVEFPWRAFTPGTNVSEVACPGESTIIGDAPTGTTLLISSGKSEEWNKIAYQFVLRQLATLAANRGLHRKGAPEEDPGFNAIITAPGFSAKAEDLREKIIDGGWGTIEAAVDSNGLARYTLVAKGLGKKHISAKRHFNNLSGVRLRIGLFPHDKDYFREPSLFSKMNLSKILTEWGGVQVRYNEFRVYPYGDDDWLNIDRDRGLRKGPAHEQLVAFAATLRGVDPSRALLSLLSMKSHVGSVELGDQAGVFEMKASREGFIEGPALAELKEFSRFGIDWATIYRDFSIRTEQKSAAKTARESLEAILSESVPGTEVTPRAVQLIRKQVEHALSLLPDDSRREVQRNIVTASDAILKRDKTSQSELQHLRLIASTSTLLLVFTHEVKSLLGFLQTKSVALENLAKQIPAQNRARTLSISKGLLDYKERLRRLVQMTSLISVDGQDAKTERLALLERLEAAKACLSLIIESYTIEFNLDKVPANITVGPMLEAELYSVFLNLFSNAIKSVLAVKGGGRIEVEALSGPKGTTVWVRDSGLGIDKAHWESVFEPFVVDPNNELYSNLKRHLNQEDQFIVGTGSGLGLSIVREILEVREGSIRFTEPPSGWKAQVEVRFP